MTIPNLDELMKSARLSGRIDLLMEMKAWLNTKIAEAERANEEARATLNAQRVESAGTARSADA